MRIACLQFAPQVGDVDNNLNRADSVLSKANPEDIDLLVLPELAFTGYDFKSLQDIAPFLEPSGSGITSLWARTIALKYNCAVTVGYPEKVDPSPNWPTGPEYYNSAIVVNEDGETIANYRKNFLYYTDETWALEGGRGFYDGVIPGLGSVSIGICMDINPYKFEAPWHAFEFASHVLEVESNLVIVSMAWMTREDPRDYSRMPNEPDMETLTYWITRLEPLIRSDNNEEIIVVFCNRSGNEGDALYAGTSAVVGIHDGEVKVYGLLGRGQKNLLVVDTNDPPYARLVYRPDAEGPGMEAQAVLQKEGDYENANDKNQGPDESKYGKLKGPETVTSGYQDERPSTDTSFKQRLLRSTTPPLPIPKLLRKEFAKDSFRRHHPPAITIPQEPDLVSSNSARTPGTDSLNIPTPSAPSPTPMAIRPRLIIPESPPILPHQYPPDHPISAASLMSERSVQSFTSFKSSMSTETIRSNPRPPEESTPYPNTATPLSGYPSNSYAWENGEHGGDAGFGTEQDPFDSGTPFDDETPASATWYWGQGDSRLQTPNRTATWNPGTPMWRHPEPFPWPAITGTPGTPSTSIAQSHPTDDANQDLQEILSKSSNPNDSAVQAGTNNPTNSESPEPSKGTMQTNQENERPFARPPSTKSRNASCSGTEGRSRSALGDRESSREISQHLENISRRAESLNRMRGETTHGSTPSTTSRNCSRGRPGNNVDLQQDHQASSSPGFIKNDGRSPYRPLSRAKNHQRRNSSTRGSGTPNLGDNERTGTPNSVTNTAQAGSRPASRGRTPGPKVSSISGKPHSVMASFERASSVDSTRNDLLHSRISGQQSQGRQSETGRTPLTPRNSRGRQSQAGESVGFERAEAIVSPSCPVHGRPSSSDQAQPNGAASPQNQFTTRHSHTDNSVLRTDHFQHATRQTRQGHLETRSNQNIGEHAGRHALGNLGVSSSNRTREASEHSSPGTFKAMSSGRSPISPFYFEPSTPMAMALETDDADIEPLPHGQLDSYESRPPTRRVNSDSVHTLDLPIGSATA